MAEPGEEIGSAWPGTIRNRRGKARGVDAAPAISRALRVTNTAIRPRAFVALLLGNVALAFGPWLVRLSGVGPAT